MNTLPRPERSRRVRQVCFLILALLIAVALIGVVLFGIARSETFPYTSLVIRTDGGSDVLSGVRFVASSRGKYYYPVLSERGQGLSLKYRVYFDMEEEAQASGYLKWEP